MQVSGQQRCLTGYCELDNVITNMNMRASGIRLIGMGLLLITPTVAGSPLGLGLHSPEDPQGHVEAEHKQDCLPSHDHTFCTLILRSPWTVPQLGPRFLAAVPAGQERPIEPGGAHGAGLVDVLHARDPPLA